MESDTHVRCLFGWVPDCDPRHSQTVLNARYILIDERFPYYNARATGIYGAPDDPRIWEKTADTPWLKEIFHDGDTLVWKIEF